MHCVCYRELKDMHQIFAVAGPPGGGKTAWIAKQVEALVQQDPQSRPLYSALGGAGSVLDGMLLASQVPRLEVLEQLTPEVFQAVVAQQRSLFIEIDSRIDIAQLVLPEVLNVQNVALMPQDWRNGELEAWSDLRFPSEVALAPQPPISDTQICAIELQGQVIDPASLEILWQELTGGAYGVVHRAKGLFCLADGSGVYFSYVKGHGSRQTELNLEPCLEGRPSYPSALEVMGNPLEGDAILATTRDCLLSDQVLQQHQAQLKAMQEMEAA